MVASLFMRFSLAILLNETTFNSDDLILQVFKGLKACLKWKVHFVIQLVYRHNTQIRGFTKVLNRRATEFDTRAKNWQGPPGLAP